MLLLHPQISLNQIIQDSKETTLWIKLLYVGDLLIHTICMAVACLPLSGTETGFLEKKQLQKGLLRTGKTRYS